MSVLLGTQPQKDVKHDNQLLAAMPAADRAALLGDATVVDLHLRAELFAPGDKVRRLFFPTTSVCSLLLGLRSGQRAETGTVGNEGFVGIPAILGTVADEYAIVQVPGRAYMLDATSMRALIEKRTRVRELLQHYIAHAYHAAKQNAICIAYHNIDQRLARWLLTAHDRAHRDEFPLTQELLSHMVAASRPRVGEAQGRLRARGVIDHGRGWVKIKDRKKLEERACECYGATVWRAR